MCVWGREVCRGWLPLHWGGGEGWERESNQILWRLGGLQAKAQSSHPDCFCLQPLPGLPKVPVPSVPLFGAGSAG